MARLDFDALSERAEQEHDRRERAGLPHPVCPLCEDDAYETGDFSAVREPLLTCWCGVCLKYHHDDDAHEAMPAPEEQVVP